MFFKKDPHLNAVERLKTYELCEKNEIAKNNYGVLQNENSVDRRVH